MSKLDLLQQELEKVQREISDGTWKPVNSLGKKITPSQVREQHKLQCYKSGFSMKKFINENQIDERSYSKFRSENDPTWTSESKTFLKLAQINAVYSLKTEIALLEKQEAKNKKRKGNDTDPTVPQKKAKVDPQIAAILAVPLPEPCPVYANCDEVREMIEQYLAASKIPYSRWINALDINSNTYRRFFEMDGKNAGAGSALYVAAWKYFEQKRILDGAPKSARRLEQERRWGSKGFPLKTITGMWVRADDPYEEFDIEVLRDKGQFNHY